MLEPLIGRNSVILLDEAPHLEQRKLMLPAFHGEKMQRLTGTMTELTERELDSWPRDVPVALHPRLQQLTLEIILRAVFGLEEGQRLDGLRDSLTGVLTFSESPLSVLPALRRFTGWMPSIKRFDSLTRRANELMFELVAERRAAEQAGEPLGDDILAMLLQARHEDGSPMSADELRDELMTALVAGHETTASQLAWAFERLAREPAVVARLAEEIDAGEGDEYLNATINEILRHRPVLPNAEPRLTKRPITIGGFEYPAGVSLLASAFLVHHDPEIYPEPEAFRPERFVGTSRRDLHVAPVRRRSEALPGSELRASGDEDRRCARRSSASSFRRPEIGPSGPPGGASRSARPGARRSCCASAAASGTVRRRPGRCAAAA